MTDELPGPAPHVFVIAEAGSNWRMGSIDRDRAMARELIRVAADAGANAVKFQTFRASSTYASDAGQVAYLHESGVSGSINELFRDLELPYELIPELAAYSDEMGIEFMSTAFSVEDAARVDPFVRRHKVASYEICHVRLLQRLASTGKPLLISTGAANEEDIAFSLRTVRSAGAGEVTLLQCTAAYPAPLQALNLAALTWLRDRFGTNVGLSDHSVEPLLAPTMAVSLGGTVIEKHFTLSRRLPGPDHQFALEPQELADLVHAVRAAEKALGTGTKAVMPAEDELRQFAVRSIQATEDIAEGERLIEGANFDVLRPGTRRRGLHPRYLGDMAGRRAARAIGRGDGIGPDDVAPNVNVVDGPPV